VDVGILLIFQNYQGLQSDEQGVAGERKSYEAQQGAPAPPPLTGDLMFCHANPERAEGLAMQHMPNYFLTIIRHYESMGEHFKHAKGYEHYASASDAFKAVGLELAADSYCSVQTWGTPEAILEKLRWRRELMGGFELNLIVNYGGLPTAEVEASLRLFAQEVLPELHSW
jgi:hypothetical protein